MINLKNIFALGALAAALTFGTTATAAPLYPFGYQQPST